jgi:CheY-like chemotaxis protein
MSDLLLETPLNEDQRSYVDSVRVCAESLLGTLSATLEFSTITAGALRLDQIEFALPETLLSAVEFHRSRAEAKGLRITCLLDPKLPGIAVGDPFQLRRLLDHLLDNAIKFTHEGVIDVRASANLPAGGGIELVCQVRDTGIGIPVDRQDVIFDSFTQLETGFARSYSGLGLGLAIARKLARFMGGDIDVESKPGVGSRFSVAIPFRLPVEQTAEDGSLADRDSGHSANKRKILLVEDNPAGRAVVTHLLQKAGYAVSCADSGTDAIQQASADSHDLILMDLHMPDLDGFETYSRIRTLPGCAKTPILALTVDVTDETRRRCSRHGFDAFIPKPVQAAQLLSTISQFLP